MIKPTLKSIILPSIFIAVWLLGNNELISFSEPVSLILLGVILLNLADIGKKRFKKNKQIPSDAGRQFIKSD